MVNCTVYTAGNPLLFFFFLYPSTVDQEDNLKDLISKGCALQNISIRDGRRTTKKKAV